MSEVITLTVGGLRVQGSASDLNKVLLADVESTRDVLNMSNNGLKKFSSLDKHGKTKAQCIVAAFESRSSGDTAVQVSEYCAENYGVDMPVARVTYWRRNSLRKSVKSAYKKQAGL